VVLQSGQVCGWDTREERRGDVQCWEGEAVEETKYEGELTEESEEKVESKEEIMEAVHSSTP